MKTPIGRLDPSVPTVHIWGGGIAGLLMGHFLSSRGYSIELYEKSARLGGKIGTDLVSSGPVEWGPNALYATDEILEWLPTLGLTPLPCHKRLKRWIWQDGLVAPRKRDLLKRVIPRLLKSAPNVTSRTTVADFFIPLLGSQTVKNLVSPGLQGIYGTTADELTVLSLWPELEGLELPYWKALQAIKGPRARSVSFAGGMQELVDGLARTIRGRIHLNHQGSFELRPNTIICTDAHVAAELLRDLPQVRAPLRRIRYLPIASVTLHASVRVPWSSNGFGVLFPRQENFRSLGCLFNHSIFPGRVKGAAHSSFTFITNEVIDPMGAVGEDLAKLDCPHGDVHRQAFSYPRGLPLYDEARWSAIRELKESDAMPPGIVLFGNYVAGISLRDMIRVAEQFADSHSRS